MTTRCPFYQRCDQAPGNPAQFSEKASDKQRGAGWQILIAPGEANIPRGCVTEIPQLDVPV